MYQTNIDLVNGFVDNLLQLGTDAAILTDAVHGSSQTLDSRHFVEEFVRRRKLADKGISVENPVPAIPSNIAAASSVPSPTGNSSGGGWSEVAKKGPTTANASSDNGLGSFKVVQAKKKGGKR
jgi:PERQ amino acid-rich with GYF domain-containing protein